MSKRKILHIILWIAAVACFGMTVWSFYEWIGRGGQPDDPNKYHWMIWGGVGVICVGIWFFTREEEEEVSITRAG